MTEKLAEAADGVDCFLTPASQGFHDQGERKRFRWSGKSWSIRLSLLVYIGMSVVNLV